MDPTNLIDALEPDQRIAETRKPLPRRKLNRSQMILLVALRIYVVIAVPLVGYAFFHALHAG